MKVELENVEPDKDRSFRILLTPGLNDRFFWHFHPEYEIVYVEGAGGIRHIGQHISRYEGSDLAFIGPHIPHLNFDYGVSSDCEQVIVQMKADFLGQGFLQLPEMASIRQLFRQAEGGLLYSGETKRRVGERLKKLPALSNFDQLMELLQIFRILAGSEEVRCLQAKPALHSSLLKQQERMRIIYEHLDRHFQQPADLEGVAALCHLSVSAFCRYFKNLTGMTYTEFLNQYRVNHAQTLLLQDKTVTEICYECGFESLSHFSKTFKKRTGLSPAAFRKQLAGI